MQDMHVNDGWDGRIGSKVEKKKRKTIRLEAEWKEVGKDAAWPPGSNSAQCDPTRWIAGERCQVWRKMSV